MPVGSTTLDWLAALHAPGLGDRGRSALVRASGAGTRWAERAGSPAARALGLDLRTALARGADDRRTATALDWLRAPDQHLLTLDDPDYPPLLAETDDPPPALYLKGCRSLLAQPALAIVGSRNPSALGAQTAEALARTFSQAGLTVVSGLALGIDAAAHRGALDGPGSTIAVVGTGLDIVYPARNRSLAHRVAASGALVSEFALGTPARASHFPRRNRILSGLALGCLVVEANLRSGSLITARLAAEQGREVFAIPGSIHSPLSKGCHALIRQGAKLTESAADVIEELGWGASATGRIGAEPAPPGAVPDADARALLAALGHDPASADTLVERTGWTAQRVAATLFELELAGRVGGAGPGVYQRLADPGFDFAGVS